MAFRKTNHYLSKNIRMEYSGIQYTPAPLAPQELDRLKKRSAQEMKINLMVVLPALAAVAVIVFYCNSEFKGQDTLLEIINGVGGLAGGLLAWHFIRFLLTYRADFKNGKKKITTGMVEGKRILNQGKFNESHRMLFNRNEFEITPEIYNLVQKGMKVELHVTEKNERVIAIKKLL